MRIFEKTTYDFVGKRKAGYVISGIIILLSILSFATRGIQAGIDFQSGMEFVVATDEPLDAVAVRGVLANALGSEPEVKTYDTDDQLLIRTVADREINEAQAAITGAISQDFPGSNPTLIKTDVVGPRFADDLKRGAFYSVIGALFVIFLYIMVRFTWRFSLGAVAALAHDVTITLGLFSLLQGVVPFSLDINQAIIAALLTIVGYSLNDTVVVFDRIREYTNLFKTEPPAAVINRSINSTLSRTMITSGTTLLVVLTLFIFGGEVLRGFAFALLIGIVVGTYSSIFVASPVVLELRERAAAAAAVPVRR